MTDKMELKRVGHIKGFTTHNNLRIENTSSMQASQNATRCGNQGDRKAHGEEY